MAAFDADWSEICKLRELLADKLNSFALLNLVLQDQRSFELALNSAASINDIHAVQLLDDIWIPFGQNVLKEGDGHSRVIKSCFVISKRNTRNIPS